jgi:hypothetical protein
MATGRRVTHAQVGRGLKVEVHRQAVVRAHTRESKGISDDAERVCMRVRMGVAIIVGGGDGDGSTWWPHPRLQLALSDTHACGLLARLGTSGSGRRGCWCGAG